MNLLNEWRYRLKYSNPVNKLILVNAAVFLVYIIFNLFAWGVNNQSVPEGIRSFLSFPSEWSAILARPWTIITYQFTHFKLFHVLFNMIILNMAGTIFMDFFKKQDLYKVYLMGGALAALLFALMSNVLPVFANQKGFYLMGASASVMAILFAATTYAPNIRLTLFGLFEIKLVWFALFFLLIDLVSIPDSNAGGHIAHIGGVILGWFYAWYKKNEYQFRILDKNLVKSSKRSHLKVEINESRIHKSNVSSNENSNRVPTQEEVDAVLDKISKSGYNRLSKEEKDILFKASQE